MARTPETGPNPTSITKKIAQIILGKVLIAASKNLNGIAIESLYKFLEAKVASGKLIMNPNPVETKAIFNVSIIPIYAGEQRKSQFLSQVGYDLASITFQLGGHKDSRKNLERLSKLFYRLAQFPSTRSTNIRYVVNSMNVVNRGYFLLASFIFRPR